MCDTCIYLVDSIRVRAPTNFFISREMNCKDKVKLLVSVSQMANFKNGIGSSNEINFRFCFSSRELVSFETRAIAI